ncbi:MAG TPA: nuclear transport factor 2 family protein [Gammaproteobacteria bacterium]|jgi:ketosteroid isomerase-like protein
MRIVPLISIAALLSLPGFALAADPTPAPAAASKSAPPAESDEKQIEDLEQTWLDTSLKQDHDGLDAILMDDFEDVSWQGELRGKTEIMAIAMSAPVKSSQTLSDLKVRVHGDVGVVTGVNTAEAADKSFTVKVRFTDVFVRDKGHWRALSAQETIEKGP